MSIAFSSRPENYQALRALAWLKVAPKTLGVKDKLHIAEMIAEAEKCMRSSASFFPQKLEDDMLAMGLSLEKLARK